VIDIKALKTRLDLVKVVTDRGVVLKGQGTNLLGSCPFHEDSTPSLSVNPKTRLWSCFGCRKGGDVITFVQEFDHVGFGDAVRRLSGETLSEQEAAELERRHPPRPAVAPPRSELLDGVLKHWQSQLGEAPKAQDYLKRRRLWSPELLERFRVGFASGSLKKRVARGDESFQALQAFGLFNDRGNEFLFNRIVVPIFHEGRLVNVYGRAIDTRSVVAHLYLPGPRRGVFNGERLASEREVILTESVFDALSLIVLGFPNTTASYGVAGFTEDHLAALRGAQIERVLCAYDADRAGDDAAHELADQLGTHGIKVLRVQLPCKDPNEFLQGGGTQQNFASLLAKAAPMGAKTTRPTSSPTTKALAEESEPSPSPADDAPNPSGAGGSFRVQYDTRAYEVTALPGQNALTLRVRLRVRHGTKNFVDILNLYSDRARNVAVTRLAKIFGGAARPDQIEADFFGIIDRLEQAARVVEGESAAPTEELSPAARNEALAFLKLPDLADRIRADIGELGVVGEDQAKLLVYLVATSRKLLKPLSLCVVSRSSAGKSFLVMRTAELMPPEEVLAYTRLSAKALFHDESDRLRHKLMMVEEAQGMEEAAYALRVMQSSQVLKNLSTITDPTTGRHKAQENVVYGPVALVVTTTRELDFETVSRAFVISVDESVEQTERIHELQRLARTLDGLVHQTQRDTILRTHQNAQRLLAPLRVVNDLAPYLTFPTGTLRLRREQEKYLTLIEAITFLFQFQRDQGVYGKGDAAISYVKTAIADIDLANRLVVSSLRQAFEEITTPSRELLAAIRRLVMERGGGEATTDVRFSRRELREFTRWSDYQVRIHLKQLEELEYVQAITGSFGKQYVYTLSPDHRLAITGEAALEEQIRELGLTSGAEAAVRMAKKRKPHPKRP